MPYASTALRKIQISSPEAVVGTADAATEVLVGMTYDISRHDREFIHPEQDRGTLDLDYGDAFVVSKKLEGSLSGLVNHRQIVWWLSNAIRGNVTPTQPDAINQPNTYQWVFAPSMTAGNTPDLANGIDTFTLEWGDTQVQQYQGAYMVTRTLTIEGDSNGEVTVSVDFTVTSAEDSAFTAALTVPSSIQYFATNKAKYYVDTSWATLGNTQKNCKLRSFSWELETGIGVFHSINGDLKYCGISEMKKGVNLSLSLYVDNTEFIARETQYNTNGVDFVRIELVGYDELDSGESNPPAIYLDQAIRYEEMSAPSDEDGVQVVEFTAYSVKDATSSNNFQVTVLTDLTAFP